MARFHSTCEREACSGAEVKLNGDKSCNFSYKTEQIFMHLPFCAYAPDCASHSNAMCKYAADTRRTDPTAQKSMAAAAG